MTLSLELWLPPLVGGLPTARSLIIVTPDAQRTMQTFLGATTQLGPEDVDMDHITASQVVYMEGCTAPKFNTATLHSAVVELVALKGA